MNQRPPRAADFHNPKIRPVMNKPLYLQEFPNFDHELPELPEGFVETSWHNDTSPSWQCVATGNLLYINFKAPELREYPSAFFVITDGENGPVQDLYCGDDFSEALRVAMA